MREVGGGRGGGWNILDCGFVKTRRGLAGARCFCTYKFARDKILKNNNNIYIYI